VVYRLRKVGFTAKLGRRSEKNDAEVRIHPLTETKKGRGQPFQRSFEGSLVDVVDRNAGPYGGTSGASEFRSLNQAEGRRRRRERAERDERAELARPRII